MKIGLIERLSVCDQPMSISDARTRARARSSMRGDVVLERGREVAAEEADRRPASPPSRSGGGTAAITEYCSAASATLRAIAPPVSKLGAYGMQPSSGTEP